MNLLALKYRLAKSLIIPLFVVITVVQVFSFPGQFNHMRKINSIDFVLELFLTLLVGGWLLCGQIALVIVWKLLENMQENQFFSVPSLKLVDKLVLITRIAAFIPLILFSTLIWQAEDPGFFVLLSGIGLFLVTFHLVIDLLRNQIKEVVEGISH